MGDSLRFVQTHLAGDYASETSSNARLGPTDEISAPALPGAQFRRPAPAPGPSRHAQELVNFGNTLHGLDAYSRHKKFINDYVISYGPERVKNYLATTQSSMKIGKTDQDVLRENHQFIRDGDDDTSKWEVRMAVKYYQKLFKVTINTHISALGLCSMSACPRFGHLEETPCTNSGRQEYCIADMSRYTKGQFGLRWRTQDEVFKGKGQFVCGNQNCRKMADLQSYEMNFAYKEQGEKKNALVKLRVCPDCSLKLNYKKLKKREKEEKKKAKKEKKRRKKQKAVKDSKPEVSGALEDPEDWEQKVSRSTGKSYWYQKSTGATQWTQPNFGPSAGDGESSTDGSDSEEIDNAQDEPGGQDRTEEAKSAAQKETDEHGNEIMKAPADIWTRKPKEIDDGSDDEFDEYFKGMFP